MGFTILNPLLLFFGLFISVPVIIHLFHRRRYKEVKWAAMEFLLKSQKKSRSMLKLRYLLLLLFRCLAVAFVVLAISQPLIKAPSFPGIKGKSAAYAAIILDNSYSMSEKQGNKDLFDIAKQKASEITGLLRQGDSVSVIASGWKAKAVIKEPTYQLSAAKKVLEDLKIGNSGNDLGGALQIAAELIKNSKEASKEIYIISDCQASMFREAGNDIKNVFSELSGKVSIFLVKTGGANPGNNAITGINFSREVVDTVLPVRITAEVANYSKKDVLDCVADLYINDRLRDSKRLVIRSGRAEPVAFYHKFSATGINTGYIEISADPLLLDNRAYFCVSIRGSVPVLIVDGKPSKRKFGGESGFLSFAFSPYGPEDIGKKKVISSSVCDYSSFNINQLSGNKAVILSNVSYLPEEMVLPLDTYVRNGNGVLFFAGDLVNPGYYNSRFYKEKSGILPCFLGSKVEPEKEGDTFFIDKINTGHPLMSKFKEKEIKELKKTRFGSFYELKADLSDPSVSVLAVFNNGMPAVVSKKCGKGNTVIIATGANRRWSDLVIKPMFLPLLYETVYYLSSGTEERRNLKIADKIKRIMPFGTSQDVKLFTPGGKQAVYKSSVNPEGRIMEYEDTLEAGFYKLLFRDEYDYYAINLETKSESDTERAKKEYIMKLATAERFVFIDAEADAKELILQGRHGIGIWKELLLIAVLMLAVESYLAYRFGKRV
ncbi:MAG: BatA and WFA domain-containing protein [Candidatus Firestonebacteria bacterium]